MPAISFARFISLSSPQETNVVENDTDLKFATALSVYQESSAESPDQQHGIMGIANMGYTLDGNMRLLQHAGGGYYKEAVWSG